MATKKKFYCVYRIDDSDPFDNEDNVFICEDLTTAYEIYDNLVNVYLSEVYPNLVDPDTFERVDDDIYFVRNHDEEERNWTHYEDEQGRGFTVWMDKLPREVINAKTRFKNHLW